MNQEQVPISDVIRQAVMNLAFGGVDAVPSPELIEFASARGWIASVSKMLAARSFTKSPPTNEAQRKLLRDIQLEILRGYLLADPVRSFS